MLVNSILIIIFAAKFYELRQVEPPSPILKDQKFSADQTSDDPLSRNIHITMGSASGESLGVLFVRSIVS